MFKSTQQAIDNYLDYWNNFLTVSGYADYYHKDLEQAQQEINTGRELYHATLPKRYAVIKVGRKKIYVSFGGQFNKNTVLLSNCTIVSEAEYLANTQKVN